MQHYGGSPKILIENIIYVSTLDVFIYTTSSPQTSSIIISKLKGNKSEMQKMKEGDSKLMDNFNNASKVYQSSNGVLLKNNHEELMWSSLLHESKFEKRYQKEDMFGGDNESKKQETLTTKFEFKTLARLLGHSSHCAPTIMYVAESGC